MGNLVSAMFLAPLIVLLVTAVVMLAPVSDRIRMISLGSLLATISIAMSSIGIKFFNNLPSNKKDDDELKSDRGILIGLLILSILGMLGSMFLGHTEAKKAGVYNMFKTQ